MKDIDFPLFKTKIENSPKFDLTDAKQRQEYFELKCGEDIKKLREYLKNNTFVAYLLGKKSSGKGTYAKMLAEVVAPDKIIHFSVGDMIRSFDEVVKDPEKKKELIVFLEKNYRGYLSLADIMVSLENRSTKTLLPSELILALAKKEIAKFGKKAIFIDGFPRDLDQVSYSLFFRDLIGYREDPDVFILIDVPSSVIDERIKFRVICPLCNTSRNLKLLATKNIEYDLSTDSGQAGKFYLLCDNSACKGVRMVAKEGDELGIDPIRQRLNKDEMLIKRTFSLQGIPRVLLRNSVPADKSAEYVDDYEITPEYAYAFDEKENKVNTLEKPWEVLDDEGVLSNSLMPPPVVVSLIKQLVKALSL
ncbi:MAG: Uncharacterized protein CEN87_573 [Parcubacteria group bacterium Licking1014_1]|nr:MAG: Uncharacterized protein CEN87_573 [Parcubacteria group bacterium Licking1014_1]